ncbi:MAG: hypothetical protein H7343_20840 [Undibacterium sp.]|nr:hypothetical protein [Opitutaceae bacterium]
MSGHVAYTLNLKKSQLRFQLNISNALDHRKPITTSFGTCRVQGAAANAANYAPNGFRFIGPRQLIFSTTLKF